MRRRMLNPEFFTDPDLVANLDFAGRLFYQGLWCIADDSGVFDPNLLAMKMKIFPGDNLDLKVIQEYYKTLQDLGKVIEFEVNSRVYAWLKNFHKHQKLDRPSPPSLPLPKWIVWHGEEEYGKERHRWNYEILDKYLPGTNQVKDNSPNSRRTFEEQDTIEVKLSEVKLSEGEEKRKEGGSRHDQASFDEAPTAQTIQPEDATTCERAILHELKQVPDFPDDYTRNLTFIRALAVDYPNLDLLEQAKKWRVYKLDKPLKPKSNPRLQFRNWCEIATKRTDMPTRASPQAHRVPRAFASLMEWAEEEKKPP